MNPENTKARHAWISMSSAINGTDFDVAFAATLALPITMIETHAEPEYRVELYRQTADIILAAGNSEVEVN
jgi:hypothetical protein